MVELRNGNLGTYTLCEWCNQPLQLESKSNYEKCVNCGGKYNDPYEWKPKYKSAYNWYYFLKLFFRFI